MAKNKTYIILFSDGTLLVHNLPRFKSKVFGSRKFECDDNLPVIELCEWQGKGYKHSKIKEIGKEIGT